MTSTAHRLVEQASLIEAKLHEVAVRYAWARRRRRGFVARPVLTMMVRLRELERLFASRYGAILSDDDAGREDLFIAVNTIAGAYGGEGVVARIMAWASMWAPWLPDGEAETLAARVVANPYRWKADTLAWRLGLKDAERARLGITTIGAIDMSKAERLARRKEHKRAAQAAKRRANALRKRPNCRAIPATGGGEADMN